MVPTAGVPGFNHEPVLIDAVLEHLAPRDDGVYFDGTLGGGGHAERLLEAAPRAQLVAVDRDPEALAAATARLARFGERVHLVHAAYADIAALAGTTRFDGMLLDLGVSSWQLDVAARGFSFSKDGPLDMRMDPTRGITAAELIHQSDITELAQLIRDLGEERHAKKIARAIKYAEAAGTLRGTADLAAAITTAIPLADQRTARIHVATRTFQALRIAVNGELDQLATFLDAFPDVLAAGGRCAIISFHSLEDRMVKQRFRDLAWTSSLPPHIARQAGERVAAVCTPVTRKVVVADDAEIERNPRARSARLRVCERTAAPNVAATRAGARRPGS